MPFSRHRRRLHHWLACRLSLLLLLVQQFLQVGVVIDGGHELEPLVQGGFELVEEALAPFDFVGDPIFFIEENVGFLAEIVHRRQLIELTLLLNSLRLAHLRLRCFCGL